MGLKDVRSKAIECLQAGRVQAANRANIQEKNLLKIGLVSPDEVIALLKLTRGDQYRTEPHESVESVEVHFFTPHYKGEDWYIKLYFLDPDCWFISVHKSHVVKTTKKTTRKAYGNLQRRR